MLLVFLCGCSLIIVCIILQKDLAHPFFINMLTALKGCVLFLFAQERCGYDNRLQVVSDCAKKNKHSICVLDLTRH